MLAFTSDRQQTIIPKTTKGREERTTAQRFLLKISIHRLKQWVRLPPLEEEKRMPIMIRTRRPTIMMAMMKQRQNHL